MIVDNYTRIAGTTTGGVTTGKSIAAAATTTLTDTIDLQQSKDMGQGEDVYFVFSITTSFSGTGECYFQAGYGDTATPTTFYPFTQSTNYAQADLVAGRQIVVRLNPVTAATTAAQGAIPLNARPYLCARVVATNGTSNTGAFLCDVVHGIQGNRQNYNVGYAFVAGA